MTSASSSASSNNGGGYGSINNTNNQDQDQDGDVETAPLLIAGESSNSKSSSSSSSSSSNESKTTFLISSGMKRIIVGAFLGIAVVLITGGSSYTSSIIGAKKKNKKNSSLPSSSSSSSSKVDDDNNNNNSNDPFRLVSPVDDLGMLSVKRNDDALPSSIWGSHLHKQGHPLPTNSWYLNLVSHRAATRPDDSTRVYTVPYLIDTATPLPVPTMQGLRIHWPVVQASDVNIQMVDDYKNSICLGSTGFQTWEEKNTNNNRNSEQNNNDDDNDDSGGDENEKKQNVQNVNVNDKNNSDEQNDNDNNSDEQNNNNNNDDEQDGGGSSSSSIIDGSYRVTDDALSPLGVGLEWGPREASIMSTNIVRGMPYATMEYNTNTKTKTTIPTIYSYNGLASDVQIDRTSPYEPIKSSSSPKLKCGIEGSTSKKGKEGTTVRVKNHIHLHFINSDFTWMVFFNKPVQISCVVTNNETEAVLKDFKMTILEDEDDDESTDNDDEEHNNNNLVVRVALLNQCTTGHATLMQHCKERNALKDPEGFEQHLKQSAHLIPKSPTIDFEYSTTTTTTTTSTNDDNNNNNDIAKIKIDWDAVSTKISTDDIDDGDNNNNKAGLLMYALPHHQTSLSGTTTTNSNSLTEYCINSFHGSTCLVESSKWVLEEDLGTPLSFLAPRPPQAEFISTIAEYMKEDIKFHIPDNTLRGAADTYFSGKILSRLARIIVIASELKSLAKAAAGDDNDDDEYNYYGDADVDTATLQESMDAASKAEDLQLLPTSKEMADAVDQLKTAVQAWLKSDAEAPYIYDESWGGLVNCGCHYVGKADQGFCNNTYPDCPALLSVNEDFGNGYYNDHHYHYGYHVYAAAVVAKFDPAWGREHFDEVMIYIRDFANPYGDDEFFPQYRQKDWYLGSSWASGIVSAENSPHGRNEESSSEAISAYEGVTLFGSAMVDAFEEVVNGDNNSNNGDDDNSGDDDNAILATKLETAKLIRDSGQLLTASEIHATNRYWHVWSSDTHNSTYPSQYSQPVVGMLYDTMASFQTWFAPWAVVSYGIQLIPLTPVAETRDDVEWATQLYPLYEKACNDTGDFCEDNGWSILQAGLLATTGGNHTDAVKQAKAIPKEVFATDGGVGNSMSNTIWYIATRKKVP